MDLFSVLLKEHEIDIAVLTEVGSEMRTLIEDDDSLALVQDYVFPDSKVQIVTRRDQVKVEPRESKSNRYGAFVCKGPNFQSFILVGVHLASPCRTDIDSRRERAQEFAGWVDQLEESEKSDRTIVIGDFNLNPFDRGLFGRRSLNALPCQREVKRNAESKKSRRPFYNPTWNLLGDQTPGPPGTHYYSSEGLRWNTYDQVLLRASLMSGLTQLKVLEQVAGRSLCTRAGLPNGEKLSDHLPLVFTLNMEER